MCKQGSNIGSKSNDQFLALVQILTSFEPFLLAFTATQLSMDTLREQFTPVLSMLIMDVVIQRKPFRFDRVAITISRRSHAPI